MHSFYLDAIRNFEGYTPQAQWDYAQHTNGYGTRARFAGEVIDRAEAERRFRAEVSNARSIVEKAAPGVDEGTKAALTSLTYNAGTAWIGSGLGNAVRNGDLATAREIFQHYNKAGGEVLPGLVSRRSQEALWIGNPNAVAGLLDTADSSVETGTAMPPVFVDGSDASAVAALAGGEARTSAPSSRPVVASAGAASDIFERAPRADRVTPSGPLGKVASEALAALVGMDGFGNAAVADVARLAQLGRASDLAGMSRERSENETRRV